MLVPEPTVLTEYGEAEVALSIEEMHALRRLAGTRLTILPGTAAGQWVIRASSYVGTIVTPAVRILIKPKVATANLFYLLETGGRAVTVGAEVFDYERSGDLMPSFATFFVRHMESALARGVPREYREHQDRLVGIRGRVDLPAQLRLGGLPLPVECRFDEYTADTQLNRLLLGALVRLRRLPGVTVTTRQTLHQLTARFEQVGPVTPADQRTRTRFTRLNEHCAPVERLARLVLANASLRDAAGASGAAVFLVDMNAIFEQFVETRLRRNLCGDLEVRGQSTTTLGTAGVVTMKPDLVFWSGGKVVYVADTKYKVTADGLGRESDYYQLLAYTTALRLDEGLLIYCQRDGTTPPREVEVRHLGTRLRTLAVRLDRTPTDVDEAMRSLADEVRARSHLRAQRSLV